MWSTQKSVSRGSIDQATSALQVNTSCSPIDLTLHVWLSGSWRGKPPHWRSGSFARFSLISLCNTFYRFQGSRESWSLVSAFLSIRKYQMVSNLQTMYTRQAYTLAYFRVISFATIVCMYWVLNTHGKISCGLAHVHKYCHYNPVNTQVVVERWPSRHYIG